MMTVGSFIYFIITNFNNHLANNVLDLVYTEIIKKSNNSSLLIEINFI